MPLAVWRHATLTRCIDMFSHSSCRFVAEVSPHTLNNANDECTSMPKEAIGTADGGKPNLGIEFELFDDMSMQHY